jgi:hypothetical protein
MFAPTTYSVMGIAVVVLRLLLVIALLLPAGSASPLTAHTLAQEPPGAPETPDEVAPNGDEESLLRTIEATETVTVTTPTTATATATLTATLPLDEAAAATPNQPPATRRQRLH